MVTKCYNNLMTDGWLLDCLMLTTTVVHNACATNLSLGMSLKLTLASSPQTQLWQPPPCELSNPHVLMGWVQPCTNPNPTQNLPTWSNIPRMQPFQEAQQFRGTPLTKQTGPSASSLDVGTGWEVNLWRSCTLALGTAWHCKNGGAMLKTVFGHNTTGNAAMNHDQCLLDSA